MGAGKAKGPTHRAPDDGENEGVEGFPDAELGPGSPRKEGGWIKRSREGGPAWVGAARGPTHSMTRMEAYDTMGIAMAE